MFARSCDEAKWIGEKSLDWKVNLLLEYALSASEEDEKGELKLSETSKIEELVNEFIATGEPQQIFDTTCHIMAELSGAEQNKIFGKDVHQLAYKAIKKTLKETGINNTDELSTELQNSFAGIALFNMLLPKAQGGVFANESYKIFLTHLSLILQSFKPKIDKLHDVTITDATLNKYFLRFKNFATQYFTHKTQERNLKPVKHPD